MTAPHHPAPPQRPVLSASAVLSLGALACAVLAFWWIGWAGVSAACALAAVIADVASRRRSIEDAGKRGRIDATLARLARIAGDDVSAGTKLANSAGLVQDERGLGELVERLGALVVRHDNALKVLDAVGDPVLVTEPGGAVAMWNRSAENFLAREGDRILGRSIEELFTSADLVAVHAAASVGLTRHATVRLARGTATRLFEVIASPVEWRRTGGSEGGPGSDRSAAVVTLRDITEAASATQLQTDFVANASHELRTPLSSIRGAVETLIEDSDDPRLRLRLLQMIATNVSRLEELIRDLLDLSRIESPDTGPSPCPMQISAVVHTLEHEFTPACTARGLSLSFEMDDRLEAMHSDPRLVDLILRNLIENSIKFAYDQTTVRVVGEVVESSRPKDGRQTARFRVIDKGAGIPLAGQARIFERFYQIDPARAGGSHRRGTGLGLALVKSAVEKLKGTIRVESVWKQGTTMTVELEGSVGSDNPS